MLTLLYGLFVLLGVALGSAALAAYTGRDAALFPLPILAGAALALYWCAMFGSLHYIYWVMLLCCAAWTGYLAGRSGGLSAVLQAFKNPTLLLFLGGSAFIWVLFSVQQPMFTLWDEFTSWGLAPKMVAERQCLYVADPVNLTASFTYPATSLVSYLFQPFGRFDEWACLAALDTLALACFCAAAATAQKAAQKILVFGGAVLLPFFFSTIPAGTYSTIYANAMADLPLAVLFGGCLCLYFGLRGTRQFAFLALPLALLALVKDIGFAYGLIAVFIMGLEECFGDEKPRFLIALRNAGCLALVVVAVFVSWNKYTAAVTPTAATGASVGSAGLSYGAVLVGGIKQLLGVGREEKFAQIMSNMANAFFARRVCLLGSGAVAVAVLTLVAAAAFVATPNGKRRQIVAAYLGMAFCFAALYAFHLILYHYNFAETEGLALKDYERYLSPFYIGWFLVLLCLLGRGSADRLGSLGLLGCTAALAAVFAWRGLPAAGFWTNADSIYTVRKDVKSRAETANTVLDWSDRLLVLSQGDDATRWYYYKLELNAKVVNGWGGSYWGGEDKSDRWESDFMSLVETHNWDRYDYEAVGSADSLADYMEETGCTYLLIDRADTYLGSEEFSARFEGGLTADMPATLYCFAGAENPVAFVDPVVLESEAQQ